MKKLLFIILCFIGIPVFAGVTVSNLKAEKNLDGSSNVISVTVSFTMTDSATGRKSLVAGTFPPASVSSGAQLKATVEDWGKECVKAFKAECAAKAAAQAASTQSVSTATIDTAAIESAQ